MLHDLENDGVRDVDRQITAFGLVQQSLRRAASQPVVADDRVALKNNNQRRDTSLRRDTRRDDVQEGKVLTRVADTSPQTRATPRQQDQQIRGLVEVG
jgi:hypothetical protein